MFSYDELPPTSLSLSAIQISREEVYNTLIVLVHTKAADIDEIGTAVVKYCVTALTVPLHYLFSHSIKYCTFLSKWQLHYIIPIFKSGDKNNVANYRLISLLCIVSKLLDRIVYNKVINFISNRI